MKLRPLLAVLATAGAGTLSAAAAPVAAPAALTASGGVAPLAVRAPWTPGVDVVGAKKGAACVTPAPKLSFRWFHCYTPQEIRAAYGVSQVLLPNGAHDYGKGQTIVLVDAYGSPTAAADLGVFHTTFFPKLPPPKFQQIFPLGNPQYHNTWHGAGLSGPNGAAGWSGEATLDTQWAYAIAPEAHIILMAVPPAETEGVQGFPTLFRAISQEIAATPPGTMFSMSFAVTEQTFGGAAAAQVARFDRVFQQGLARHDNFFAAAGDTGTSNASKLHEESVAYPYPTVQWPASSPYVTAVGGTQLQYKWTWDPTSNTALTASGSTFRFNPAYWKFTSGKSTQAVWNESWAPIAGGGGASTIYPRPAWQRGLGTGYGNHRLLPDTSWNAAVNGGVLVYISAYPTYNCPPGQSACWSVYGGTSAATPQTAALVALANAARAAAGQGPIGFLDPILYSGLGGRSSAYTDIVPQNYGSAPQTFAGSEVGVTGPVQKSVGDLVDNQLWQVATPGYPTTKGWDATTGWGAPYAPGFVAALVAHK